MAGKPTVIRSRVDSFRQWANAWKPPPAVKVSSSHLLTPGETRTLWALRQSWRDRGWEEAAGWDKVVLKSFKEAWMRWFGKSARVIDSGHALTLGDVRRKEWALGAWKHIGEQDARRMTDDELKDWQREWEEDAARRVTAKQKRTLADEQREAYGQGAWQEISERHGLRMADAASKVLSQVEAKVRSWPATLPPDDYDFGGWVDAISKSEDEEEQRTRLMAGVIYEYARESYKLRGLLALLNPAQERDYDNVIRPNSFEGLEAATAEKALGSWFAVLLDLAAELADNLPFAKVDPKRVDSALFLRGTDNEGKHFRVSRLKFEFGRTVRHVPAVAPAYETHRSVAAGQETMMDWFSESVGEEILPGLEPSRRVFQPDHNKEDCEEVLLVRVNWRDFTNGELGEAFAAFAQRYRPVGRFEEPERKTGPGTGREIEWTQHLSALAALRLGHVLPFDAAEAEFRKVKSKLSGSSGARQERRKFEAKRDQAVQTFGQWFPFGEKPHHRLPWIQRTKAESK